MSFLQKIFGGRTHDKRLEGNWRSDVKDKNTKELIGDVTINFAANGKLTYVVKDGDKKQVINLVYWCQGNLLYTDQPSHPKEEKTVFIFQNNNTLLLESNKL